MGRDEPATLGTAEVALLLPAVQALEARAIPSGPVLAAAGLAAANLERVDERVPYARVMALWEGAASASRDPAFGIHVAATMPPGALDLIDYLFSTGPTVVDAYRRLAKYLRIYVDTVRYAVVASGALVKITRYRSGDSGAIGRQYREFIVAAFVQRGRVAAGVHWSPRRVSFGHPPHDARDEVDRFFGTAVEYGLRGDTVWLDRPTAALPLRSSDSKLSAVLGRYADSLLATAPGGTGFVGLAHDAITRELSAGGVSVAKAAGRLGMSARTFQRRLKGARTSHRHLLDETRYDLASAYLSDPSVSITQLSFMLDFADVSAFTRAFKRWSGLTPSAFRERHGNRTPGTAAAVATRCGRHRCTSRREKA